MSSVFKLRLLLDTHIFLWMTSDRARVSDALLQRLDDLNNQIVFSAALAWEIAVKRAKGKLEFSGSPLAVAEQVGLTMLPITAGHCETAAELPPLHHDPFDRLLVAQAKSEHLILVTQDPMLVRYGVPVMQNTL